MHKVIDLALYSIYTVVIIARVRISELGLHIIWYTMPRHM